METKRKLYIGEELRIPIIYNNDKGKKEADKVAERISKTYKKWKLIFDRKENSEKSEWDIDFVDYVYKMVKK